MAWTEVTGGEIDIRKVVAPTIFRTKRITISPASPAVPLAATATPLLTGQVEIKASSANAGLVWVTYEGANGATEGHELASRDFTIVYIDDLSKVYVQGSVDNQVVTVLGNWED